MKGEGKAMKGEGQDDEGGGYRRGDNKTRIPPKSCTL